MNTTKTAMIPLRCISVEQAEGVTANLTKCGCQTWAAANAALGRIQFKAPTDGSYYKTDVTVTWADGMDVRIREDVSNDGTYMPNLAERIRNLWLYYAGLRKPDHLTEEQYEDLTDDKSRKNTAVKCLTTYSLEDAVPEPVAKKFDPDTAPVWPTEREFEIVTEMLAGLIKRVESEQAKTEREAATIRKVGMELRKSLAALIRASDLR